MYKRTDQIMKETINQTIQISIQEEFKIGQLICHKDEDLCYKVKNIIGNMILAYLSDGKEKFFLKYKCFDPYVFM